MSIEKEYTILDFQNEPCGALTWRLCQNFAEFDQEAGFSRVESCANTLGNPPISLFSFFKEQIPMSDIYPVAALHDIEIFDRRKRQQGIGSRALRAFRAIVEDYNPRIAWLTIGTQGDEIDYGNARRVRFYGRDSWVALKTPPIDGYIKVSMYRVLSLVLPEDRLLRNCLVEKPKNRDILA